MANPPPDMTESAVVDLTLSSEFICSRDSFRNEFMEPSEPRELSEFSDVGAMIFVAVAVDRKENNDPVEGGRNVPEDVRF